MFGKWVGFILAHEKQYIGTGCLLTMEGRGIVILIANNHSYKGRSLGEPFGSRQISLGLCCRVSDNGSAVHHNSSSLPNELL